MTDKLREQLLGAEFGTLSGVLLTYQLINLGKRGVLDMQPVCGDAIQSRVVQHHLINKTEASEEKAEIPSSNQGESQHTATALDGEFRGYLGNDAVKETLMGQHSVLLLETSWT